MKFTWRINGIPCQIHATSIKLATPDSRWEPGDPREIEFDVLDRHGRKAEWLAALLDEDSIMEIEDSIERRELGRIADDVADRRRDERDE